MCNVLIMTFGFFIMMNATNVLQNIAPTVIHDAGFGRLGFLENGLMFCTLAFFSLAIASQLTYFGYKWTMVIGTFTYLVLTTCQLMCIEAHDNPGSDFWKSMTSPIWVLNLSTAVFNGWGNALLFVGSSTYVNACANDHNKGMYNAILWCGNTGSFITGNIIAAYVIPALS